MQQLHQNWGLTTGECTSFSLFTIMSRPALRLQVDIHNDEGQG